MTTPLRLVVFDVDGTLMDSQAQILAAMGRAFAEIGQPAPPRESVLSVVGLSLPEAFARLSPELAEHKLGAAVEAYKRAFIALRDAGGGEAAAPLYPGARAAVELLHARDEVLLGVATGKARRGLDHAFAAHDLDRFFVTRQTADQHPSKPHPAMLLSALAETGVEATQAVIVGDTTFDMEMGRAAGFATVGVSWGYHPAPSLAQAGADILIDEFAALAPAVDALWRQMA